MENSQMMEYKLFLRNKIYSRQEFISVLNDVDLTYGISIGNYTDRFELYPTQNMYQFLLLDKNFGSMWHVQWGLDSKKRWIVPIN